MLPYQETTQFLADLAEALGNVRKEDSAPYCMTNAEVLEAICDLRTERDEYKAVRLTSEKYLDLLEALGSENEDGSPIDMEWKEIINRICDLRDECAVLRSIKVGDLLDTITTLQEDARRKQTTIDTLDVRLSQTNGTYTP